MTKYQTMPSLSDEDYAALRESIVTHGVQVPVIVDEDGAIIDGHHRAEIAQSLGVVYDTTVRDDLTEDQKVALSISLNIDRRQLTREQKQKVIADRIVAKPEASDNSIATAVGVSHHTVSRMREKLVESGAVGNMPTRIDSIGREQSATKPIPKLSDYVEMFPDLQHYIDKGEAMTALRLGKALDAYEEPERSMRTQNLRLSIEAEKRKAEEPSEPDEPARPDYRGFANKIFDIANSAEGSIKKLGGAESIEEAVGDVDSMTIDLWRSQFSRLADICSTLAGASKTTLRRVK